MKTAIKDKIYAIKILPYFIGAIGLGIWLYGWKLHDFYILSVGMLLLFLQNVLYALQDLKERILFLTFHGVLFTFLLSRPFFGIFSGDEWWLTASQAEENVRFAVLIITISLVALLIGANLISVFMKIPKQDNQYFQQKNSVKSSNLQSAALLMFIVTSIFYFLQEFEKLSFMRGKSYIEYYSEFQGQLPGFVYLLAAFMKFSLCIFLATLPSKKKAFMPLLVFELSAIPSLIIGIRNPLILNSLFIFLYYFIRDIIHDKQKWIGRAEKTILIIITPIMIMAMMLYTFVRSDMKVELNNPLLMIEQFFYAQGMSVDVLSIGYGQRLNLPNYGWKNYTFGGIIDYVNYGRIGQVLFGTEALPPGNNLINAQQSNNLSHNLGYVALREQYLNGRGLGSSYLLENYFDYGYIGVFLFSAVLGAALILFIKLFYKNTLFRIVILVSLTSIFFMPRAEATGWLTFIVTMQFWLCLAVCYTAAWIIRKSGMLKNILIKLKIHEG